MYNQRWEEKKDMMMIFNIYSKFIQNVLFSDLNFDNTVCRTVYNMEWKKKTFWIVSSSSSSSSNEKTKSHKIRFAEELICIHMFQPIIPNTILLCIFFVCLLVKRSRKRMKSKINCFHFKEFDFFFVIVYASSAIETAKKNIIMNLCEFVFFLFVVAPAIQLSIRLCASHCLLMK